MGEHILGDRVKRFQQGCDKGSAGELGVRNADLVLGFLVHLFHHPPVFPAHRRVKPGVECADLLLHFRVVQLIEPQGSGEVLKLPAHAVTQCFQSFVGVIVGSFHHSSSSGSCGVMGI